MRGITKSICKSSAVALLVLTMQSAQAEGEAVKPVNAKILPLINSGYDNINKGEYDKAVSDLQKAVAADKESITARRYLAYALIMQGENIDALKQMQTLSKLVTPGPFDWYIFGQAYLGAGAPAHAKSCFSQALTYNPAYDAARGGLIRALSAQNDFDSAIAACQEAAAQARDPASKKYFSRMYQLVSARKLVQQQEGGAASQAPAQSSQPNEEGPVLIQPTNGS